MTMADELFENFSAEEAWGFYRQIGLRVSAEVALPTVKTLDELEGSLNAVLAQLDWGFVALSLDDSAISIPPSSAYPEPARVDDPTAATGRRAFAALLEGVYTRLAARPRRASGHEGHLPRHRRRRRAGLLLWALGGRPCC
ncbi:cellulose biosynthesis protein BcsD [Caulobacter segnis]